MMKKVLFSLALLPMLFSGVNSSGDFQVWIFEIARGKVYDKLYVHSQVETRFGDNTKKSYYFYGQLGLVYLPKEWIEWALYYRQEGVRIGNSDTWRVNYIPMSDLIFTWKKNGWNVNDRNRYMFLMRDPLFKPNISVYRNQLMVRTPKIPCTNIRGFAAEEIFITQGYGFNQSRSSLGLTYNCSQESNVDSYFMLRYIKVRDEWRPNYVLGFNGRLQF